MKAHAALLLAAVVLIALGLYGALQDGFTDLHPTAFIPVIFGVIMLALVPGTKKENKTVAHAAIMVTLLALLALMVPVIRSFGSGFSAGTVRVMLMQLACIVAMVSFIRSFIAARKAKQG